eukprot:1204335-Amphidinium_carterae.3
MPARANYVGELLPLSSLAVKHSTLQVGLRGNPGDFSTTPPAPHMHRVYHRIPSRMTEIQVLVSTTFAANIWRSCCEKRKQLHESSLFYRLPNTCVPVQAAQFIDGTSDRVLVTACCITLNCRSFCHCGTLGVVYLSDTNCNNRTVTAWCHSASMALGPQIESRTNITAAIHTQSH